MRKFLKTIVIYCLLLAAISLAVNAVYASIRQEPQTDKFKEVPQGIQICNFGSSHGLYSFDYESVTDRTCFNFAMVSQPLSYDCRILRRYIENMERGGTAYLPISSFSLFGTLVEGREQFDSMNRRYYIFLPKEYIIKYSAKERLLEHYLPAFAADESLFWLFLQRTDDNAGNGKTSAEYVKENASHVYEKYVKELLGQNGERLYNQEEIDAVYEMIDLCRERGVEPILVTTPVLSEFTDAVRNNDPDFFSDFYGVIEEIQEKTGVRYFDYSTDERFCYDYTLFFDVDHLNKDGARKFTDALLAETIGYRTW